MTTEKFYVCKMCGRLTTQQEINDELSNGGQFSCDCQYMQMSWDPTYKDFEPIYLRYLESWSEIPAKIYYALAKEPNTTKRRWMLATVPPEELIV